ncbi:MAG: hypothetical protein ACLGHQ_09770, partial [Acidimicrobiia bacterium]
DMVLTLVVFSGLGWLVDRWIGLFPVFTISMLVLAAIGVFTKMKYAYDLRMTALEAERSARAAARRSSTVHASERGRLEDVG